MFRWFKKWKQRRMLKRTALQILTDPCPSIDALIKARGIINAIAERKQVCLHCFQPFEAKECLFAEKFQMRSILMIPDSEPDPMLCEQCFRLVSSVYNPHVTNIGTSNAGPTNLTLQKLN